MITTEEMAKALYGFLLRRAPLMKTLPPWEKADKQTKATLASDLRLLLMEWGLNLAEIQELERGTSLRVAARGLIGNESYVPCVPKR